MSAFEQLSSATTAAVTTAPRSWVDAESIVVTAPGLATTETVTVQVVGAFGGINLYGAGATPFLYQLTATAQALVVPGGFSMQFVKTTTAAAVPIEIHTRPRPT
jgi:hypothetical protein